MKYWNLRFGKTGNPLLVVFVFFCVLCVFGDAAAARRMAVDVEVANVRSGPGPEYEILWQVEKYTPLAVLDTDKTGTWYYIKDYEGSIGWISKGLLAEIDTVITKPREERVNIRSGPGTDHDVIFKAIKGVPFKVLERKGNWIHLKHADGDEGWIHKILVW